MKALNREVEVYQAVKLGLLQIEADGTIWKVAELRGNRWNKRLTLKKIPRHRAEHDSGQYLQVRWMTEAKRVHCLAHRLVWLHYNGNIPEGMTVNHINGMKQDNRPENLEILTLSENITHAVRILKKGRTANQWGQTNHASKLTDAQVEAARAIYKSGTKSLKDLSEMYGVTYQTLSKIMRGESRQMQGGPTGDYTQRRSKRGQTP
ncbi:MAG: HNH endonuclease [Dehalococcoidia bacterium]|jgi:putative sterol carrier protein